MYFGPVPPFMCQPGMYLNHVTYVAFPACYPQQRLDMDLCAVVNPLSPMLVIQHHMIVSFKVLAQKGFIGNWISWVKCFSKS